MKFQAQSPDTLTVHAYGDNWIQVGGRRIDHSVLLTSEGGIVDWPCTCFDELSTELFEHLLQLGNPLPEVVLFGSGSRLRFPKPEWLQPLVRARVGLETMDLGAACRTYNILAGEGRRVVLAALIESV